MSECICDICENNPARKSKHFDIRLCKECRQLEEYNLICKSIAKKTYHLNDADLVGLKKFYDTNPHYKSGSTMTLFIEKELIKKCCKKYNVKKKDMKSLLDSLTEQREIKSARRRENKEIKKDERRQELIDLLYQCKLELRNDSKLCQGYIDGTIKDKTADEIVERMCQMKYLYDYCDMQKCFEKARKEQDDELKNGYFPDIPLFDQAEYIALKKRGGYPKIFPWLK